MKPENPPKINSEKELGNPAIKTEKSVITSGDCVVIANAKRREPTK